MVSVITPVYYKSNPFVMETYEALRNQTHQDWEWIVCLNNRGRLPDDIRRDERVRVFKAENDQGVPHNRVGRLKALCAAKAKSDIILELDADDLLVPEALERVILAFRNPEVNFVYSNDAYFQHETFAPTEFSSHYGWIVKDFDWEGHVLKELVAWEPSAQMMRTVFWAPDHLRAWRKSFYDELGGHNREMLVGDDHELLCRTYVATGARGMHHIDKCLYLYRRHGENTCVTHNKEVMDACWANYLQYMVPMAERWAEDNDLRFVDLGGRMGAPDGYETVDLMDAGIVADLNGPWPFEDGSVGVLRASHVLEHLRDPIHVMNEAYRVLAPGGFFFIDVPSTDGRGAFQDPTHVSFWNSNSFWYYTQKQYADFIPAFKGRFQVSRITNYYPDDFFKANEIVVTRADLICLKPPYTNRPAGEVLWPCSE